jgi:vesicle-fusing ATPase
VLLDQILRRVSDPTIEPGYTDPRHCMTLWARPPRHIRKLIAQVQQKFLAIAPHLWLMPPDNLHMTAIEVTHSRTAAEIEALVEQARPALPELVNFTQNHRPRLINPMVGFDAQALAISFVPAAGEAPLPEGRVAADDAYSYHHLRRDLHARFLEAGVEVGSRYVVPSAHLTIARFVNASDFEDGNGKVSQEKMTRLVQTVEEVNAWLRELWADGDCKDVLQWVVGEEKGLDCRAGTVWYGGGSTVMLGEGF